MIQNRLYPSTGKGSGFPERASRQAERASRLPESVALLPEDMALHTASLALDTGGLAQAPVRVVWKAESARLGAGSVAVLEGAITQQQWHATAPTVGATPFKEFIALKQEGFTSHFSRNQF